MELLLLLTIIIIIIIILYCCLLIMIIIINQLFTDIKTELSQTLGPSAIGLLMLQVHMLQ